jgi:aminopeptidase YwaD
MTASFLKQSFLVFVLAFCVIEADAQQEKKWLRHQINILAGTPMQGRGYVNKGVEKAAGYLSRKFQEFGLVSFAGDSNYYQHYSFAVNTFPGEIYLKLNRKELNAGSDYIVHAGSSPCDVRNLKVKPFELREIKDSLAWAEVKGKFSNKRAILLRNTDTVAKYLKTTVRSLVKTLPAGIYIIPQHGKITWTVATEKISPTILYAEDTVMPKKVRRLTAKVETKFIPDFKSRNVAGYVPGKRGDSFIVFCAHFDHLGKMGKTTLFPGAHDNASGTALMLYLASYFGSNPQNDNVAFIGFSGEEAGLLGSKYFVNNPLFPLGKIKMVINMDMTGDAREGITVVNGQEQKQVSALLDEINEKKSYLPKINIREQTQNSDHYHFSKAGVPAIFIFGLGGKPYYHDVFDKPQELSLDNIDNLAKLLIDLTKSMQR